MALKTLFVVSDIHYACAAEQKRVDHETFFLSSRFLRFVLKFYRNHIWLRDPMQKNYLLDRFLSQVDADATIIANGDYSCDSAFVGVSDEAAFQSAHRCLEKLRQRDRWNFRAIMGDHELGKMSFLGNRGGMRLASFHRAEKELGLDPFWQWQVGQYVLMGVVSSLIALPVFEPDTLPGERMEWERLRAWHLAQISEAFSELKPEQKVILFCHDPTALPFLWEVQLIREKLPQLERTIIGHLHSPLIYWKGRMLAGIPPIGFLGSTIRRMSRALHAARRWSDFRIQFCPALAGIELLKDGGYLKLVIDPEGKSLMTVQRGKLKR